MPPAHHPPPISPLILRVFRRIARRYFRRHFRAVSAQYAERPQSIDGPLIIFGNHPSWWDPMLVVLLGELLLPGRRHYAPMDAEALERYPILKKLGIFPIEVASPRGAAQFLRTAEAVLRSGGVLWVTPQGRFADVRETPLTFRPGLAALASRMPEVPLIPIAIEYTFWDERLPETLLHFGEPARIDPRSGTARITEHLQESLATALGHLRVAAIARNPAAFTPLLSGDRGTGGVYNLVRRVRASLGGQRTQLDHTQRPDTGT